MNGVSDFLSRGIPHRVFKCQLVKSRRGLRSSWCVLHCTRVYELLSSFFMFDAVRDKSVTVFPFVYIFWQWVGALIYVDETVERD